MVISLLVTNFVIEKQYTSSAILIVSQNTKKDSTSISIEDYTVSEKLIKDCLEMVQLPDFADEVFRNLSIYNTHIDNYSQGKSKKFVKIVPYGESRIFEIRVTWNNPEVSALLANEFANTLVFKCTNLFGSKCITILYTSKPDPTNLSINLKMIFFSATFSGLVFGLIIIYMIAYYHRFSYQKRAPNK
jgi:capsular polysaccharide biosynthesis protein